MVGPALLPTRLWLFVMPVACALIGGSAAVLLRVPQDWPLLVSPVLLAIVAFRERLQGGFAARLARR
jgi:hypothetical protein